MSSDAVRSSPGPSLDRARFAPVEFSSPFDLDAELARIPADATVRGMFVEMVNEHARRTLGRPITNASPIAFGQVSMRDYVRQLHDAARALHPNVPVREGIRRMGHFTFSSFHDTMVGKAIFAVAGRSLDRVVELCPKAYEVSYSPCSVRSKVLAPGHYHMIFEPMYVLPDCFHVGVWEDAARFCGGTVEVRIATSGLPGHVEYDARFRKT